MSAEAFRPSSERFGTAVGGIAFCGRCGHGFVAELPASDDITEAYAEAADPVSLREEPGQIETGRRALATIEHFVSPGKVLDVGCWTGSFLVAARERGWTAEGIEPSHWAAARAAERGILVHETELTALALPSRSFRLVVMCDVLEHLADPHDALDRVTDLLEDGGALYLTVPDAGSRLARVMGRRWWSVLPMHLQYFTRGSIDALLRRHSFEVRSIATHPKVFTGRYYAERLGGYTPVLERMAVGLAKAVGVADRLVAPDFRDRMAVIATRASA